VYVSTGAACSGKKGNLSHVAEALGLDQETRTGLLRFSLSAFNTGAEIDYALARIGEVLDELAFVRGRRGH
jgi:cysteine desulfurase